MKEEFNIWQNGEIIGRVEVPKDGKYRLQRISKDRIGYMTHDLELELLSTTPLVSKEGKG